MAKVLCVVVLALCSIFGANAVNSALYEQFNNQNCDGPVAVDTYLPLGSSFCQSQQETLVYECNSTIVNQTTCPGCPASSDCSSVLSLAGSCVTQNSYSSILYGCAAIPAVSPRGTCTALFYNDVSCSGASYQTSIYFLSVNAQCVAISNSTWGYSSFGSNTFASYQCTDSDCKNCVTNPNGPSFKTGCNAVSDSESLYATCNTSSSSFLKPGYFLVLLVLVAVLLHL